MVFGVDIKIWKRVFALSLPSMLGQAAAIIYGLADTYFIALAGDPNQIAAVTLSLPIFVIVMAIGTIYSMGGCSMTSRAFGAGDKERVRSITSFSIYGMLITSIIIGIIGLVFLNPIAIMAGADNDSLGNTVTYLRYIFIGAPAIMMGNGMIAVFRGHDFANQSAIGSILGNLVNIILDYILIVKLGQGVAGAAMATVLGYASSTVFYFVYIIIVNFNGNHLITLNPKAFRLTRAIVFEMYKIGTPSALVFILICVATIIINNFVGIYGATAVAAYGIAIKLNNVVVNLGNGIAQGVQPRFGFCYGAGEKEELAKTLKGTLIFGTAMGIFFLILFGFAGGFFTSFFLSDIQLKEQATTFLIILTTTTFMGVCITTIANYFQAIGKAIPSTMIVFCKNIFVFIPSIILLNHFFGLYGVLFALPVAECVTLIVGFILYFKYGRE